MAQNDPSSESRAEELFAEFLASEDPTEEEFRRLCEERVELRGSLERLRADQLEMDAMLGGALPRSVEVPGEAVLRELEALGQEPLDARAEEFLDQLASHTPRESRYRLLGEVARGGMGVVLRVRDEDLDRDLAMKTILEGAGTSGETTPVGGRALHRFLAEARITGRLDHPGIVPIHELGLDSNGRVFFTMKLVEGSDLGAVFEQAWQGSAGWSVTRVLGIVLKVCEAVSYAHDKGVVHRDIKPANIMVGSFGEVYVMDWGLARSTTQALKTYVDEEQVAEPLEEGEQAGSLTQQGDVIGTPAYMSPEQALGKTEVVDARSDIYSVGAVIYHLLARSAPYGDVGSSEYDTWRQVCSSSPAPIATHHKNLAPELIAICQKAMERDLGLRYASMGSLAEDLRAYLEGRVVAAYESGAWAEARKWVTRNKALAGAMAATLLVLVAGLSVSLVYRARAEDNAMVAEARSLEAIEQARLARERTGEVLRLSAMQDIDALVGEADELWPATPERIPAFEAWIARADDLVAALPSHRVTLEELRNDSSDRDPSAVSWWADQLSALVARLEELDAGLLSRTEDTVIVGKGWSVPKRLSHAESLRDRVDWAQAWEEALPGLRRTYPSIELSRQVGLLPLGPDPESGFWEFAHLGSGLSPSRDALGHLVIENESCIVLVLLPGGVFWMGAQATDPTGRNYDPGALLNEAPVHEVELSPFFISKYEMTQAQWRRTVGASPSYFQSSGARIRKNGRYLTPFETTDMHPVERVAWSESNRTMLQLGLTLPTEAQWEYSARAGTSTAWWCGNSESGLEGISNLADERLFHAAPDEKGAQARQHIDDGFAIHCPVATMPANPFGLHSVLGNVREWVRDTHSTKYYSQGPRLDPLYTDATLQAMTVRGADFYSLPDIARSAQRRQWPTKNANSNIGIRPARDLD